MNRRLCAFGLLVALGAAGVRADEIRLKDGSKIIGTIVDFQDESFKVQTAYGFAMVRKDSIAQIIPTEPGKSGESAKTAAPATAKPATAPSTQTPAISPTSSAVSPGVRPEPQPAVSRTASPGASSAPAPRTLASTAIPMPAPNPRATPPAPVAAAPGAMPSAASSPATASAPVAGAPPAASAAPLAPGPIRESVQGNLYINQSYNFQFFRPPGWDLMPEARKAMPNAIAAMGTSDETTLFLVGREAVKDSLDAQAANAERALKQIYENYRPVSSTKMTVGGLPAVEWKFRGMADRHDWSVTALTVARGSDVFTLLGMTYADSDIIQIRENVIAKMIASLQFSPAR